MTAITSNMGLIIGQDGDNSRTYLETALQTNWNIVDTHNHSSDSKGLAVARLAASTTIQGGGTLVWPTTSDTMVGRATTDTLSNKTLSGTSITGSLTISGTATVNANLSMGSGDTISFSSEVAAKVNLFSTTYGLAINAGEFTLFSAGGLTLRQSAWNGTAVFNINNSGVITSENGGAPTGTGVLVRQTNASIVSPAITGTVSGSATYTSATLTTSSINGLSSSTGSGNLVGATSPTITSPTISGTVAGSATYTTPTLTNVRFSGTSAFGGSNADVSAGANQFSYGTTAVTLPSPTAGLVLYLKAYGGSRTITHAALIPAGGTGVVGSQSLNNGDSVTVVADGANWWVI